MKNCYEFCFQNLNFDSLKLLKMKKLFLLFSCAAIFNLAHAQTETPVTEEIELKETSFDFGKIPQGKPVYHDFTITNIGKEPLVIVNVQTSCGCTTPKWSKEPVMPGKSTAVNVGYNAAAQGHFQKSITITYNKNETKQLLISGTVWKAPEGAAPSNASIQLLKQKNQ